MILGHALALAAFLLQTSRGVAEASPPSQPVAIVAAIEDGAWSKARARSPKPLTLYDWLEAGVVVEVAPQGRVVLIMIDGRRYALDGGAQAQLSSTGLTTQHGSIREEPRVPRLTLLAPIAGKAPSEPAAVRLRSPAIAKLNPCQAILTMSGETVLRFEPVAGASRYAIQVRTGDDQEVFSAIVEKPPLAVPAGVLSGATTYLWTVQAVGMIPPAKSEARFQTLATAVESARRSFAGALDPANSGVLGGIDLHLGLLNEAVEELTAAARRAPSDPAAEAVAQRARLALAISCP